jgi:hypothetical protein
MDEKEKSVIAQDDNPVSVENQDGLEFSKPSAEGSEILDTPEDPAQQQQQEAPVAPEVPSIDEAPVEPQPVEPTFTQSRVNELVGRARQEGRESAMKELYSRYGVNTDDELNEVFGRGQAYDGLNDEYSAVQSSYNDLRTENALLRSEVAPERYEDVKLILGGKGMDVTVENIAMMLPSHPEWKGTASSPAVSVPTPNSTPAQGPQEALSPVGNTASPTAQIRQLSTDASPETVESDEDKAMKLYGL